MDRPDEEVDGDDAQDDGPEAEELRRRRSMTVKEILSGMQGRKRAGIPMPSTVKRKEERRKRRREERQRALGLTPNNSSTPAASGNAPPSEPTALAAQDASSQLAPSPSAGNGNGGGEDDDDDDDDDATPAEPTVVAPKVTIDADGNIVIDQASLVVSATDIQPLSSENPDVVTVEANDLTKHITSASYAKRDTAQRWTKTDTDKFFEALSRFGTDFSLVEHVFPTRSRRQIKQKFKREERDNPARVEECLKSRSRMNIPDVRREFGLKGDPPPVQAPERDAINATPETQGLDLENQTTSDGAATSTAAPESTAANQDDSDSDSDSDNSSDDAENDAADDTLGQPHSANAAAVVQQSLQASTALPVYSAAAHSGDENEYESHHDY